ncbi:MAG: hypothetical protein EA353_12410 [Puniceicoccaceae bacterium]|nr:MAG: hypothetical protein EA353_12410 [Puniceicoccaceae bacterium]
MVEIGGLACWVGEIGDGLDGEVIEAGFCGLKGNRKFEFLQDFRGQGAKSVMSPPLRDRSNQDYLWNALQQGLINTLATDHAPFDFKGQKDMGRDDFIKIPNGIPSLEDRMTML